VGLADDDAPKGTTGLLDSTEGASTTQYVAPQSTVGVGVAGSSVADVQLAGGRVAPGFPRTREEGPTYIVEHLVRKNAHLDPFSYRNAQFTKTGSGQT
jgi:hypothetical protein